MATLASSSARRGNKNRYMYMPEDLSATQERKFNKIWKTRGGKAAKKYLRRHGYKPNQLAKQRAADGPPPPGPASNFNFQGPGAATASAMDAAKWQAGEQAKLNRPDQQGAFGGSQQWEQDPETGQWTKRTQLGEGSQQMIDMEDRYSLKARQAGMGAADRGFRTMEQPFSYDGVSQRYGGGEAVAGRQQASQAVYDQQMRLLKPEMESERENFEQMAAERGWVPGSKVYEKEKNRMMTNQKQQMADITDRAQMAGRQEFQTMYDISDRERLSQIGEREKERYRGFEESNMLMNTGPGARMDQFQDYGPVNMQQVDPMMAYKIGMDYRLGRGQLGLARDQFDWQRSQAGAGGGGEPGLTPAQQMEIARQQMVWERDQGFRPDYRNQGGGGGSSSSNIAGSIAAGIGQGFGAGVANAYA